MVPCPSLSTVVQLGKVALFRCPTHELIDIAVTSLSVERWSTMVPNHALQRGKVAQHWCERPKSRRHRDTQYKLFFLNAGSPSNASIL